MSLHHKYSARILRTALLMFSAAALAMTPLPAHAEETRLDTSAPIISADRLRDGEVMNYAVVLDNAATEEDMTLLKQYVQNQGDQLLSSYPNLRAFFVQSEKRSFARTLADFALQNAIALHAVGPTRTKVIDRRGEENLFQGGGSRSAGGAQSFSGSQATNFRPDPSKNRTWGLSAIGALDAAAVDVPHANVLVGVIDTGIDFDHYELREQVDVSKSVSCANNGIPDTHPQSFKDIGSHGTHVAGTIAAAHNGRGIDSVAPFVTLAAVRAADRDGLFYPEYVTCAFDWAVKQGFNITNNSYFIDPWHFWMPTEPSQAAGYEVVRRAVQYAQDNGVLNVSAAGNDNYDIAHPNIDNASPTDGPRSKIIKRRNVRGGYEIPTMLPNMVRVSSVARRTIFSNPQTSTFVRSGFSNYGAGMITVAAPGTTIYSTTPGNSFKNLDGTSMAAPHVTGVLALLKSIHPDASNERLVELLTKHAAELRHRVSRDIWGKSYEGAGLVNALSAVLKDQPQPSISLLQYTLDGQQWNDVPLRNGEYVLNVPGARKAQFRVQSGGPSTSLTLKVHQSEATVQSSDPFGQDLTAVTAEIPFQHLPQRQGKITPLKVTISATGRNNDPRADDDIAGTYTLTIITTDVQPTVTPRSADTPESSPDDIEQDYATDEILRSHHDGTSVTEQQTVVDNVQSLPLLTGAQESEQKSWTESVEEKDVTTPQY